MTEIGIRNLRIDGELGIVVPLNQSVTVPLTAEPLAYNAEFFDIRVVGNIQMLPIGKVIQVSQESPTAFVEKTEDDKLRGTVLPTVDITANSPQTVKFTASGEGSYQATVNVDEGTTSFTGKELFDLFKSQTPGLEDPTSILGVSFGFEIGAHDDCTAAVVLLHEDGSSEVIPWDVEEGEPYVDISELTAEGEGTMTVYAGAQTVTVSTEDGPTPEPTLEVYPTEFNVDREGVETILRVESNTGWDITSSQSWCRVSPSAGSANLDVVLEVSENLTSLQRTAILTVTAGDVIRTVNISQEGQESDPRVQIDELSTGGEGTMTVEAGTDDVVVTTEAPEPYLDLDQTEISTSSEATELDVIVSTNIDWEVQTDSSWCTPLNVVGHGDALIRIQVDPNESASSREGIITVSGSGLSRTVTITQAGTE